MSAPSSNPKKEGEDEMTPQEREAWLKQHGIVIETPEERRADASRSDVPPIILQLQGDDISSEIDGVELAFVPAEASKPIRSVKIPPGIFEQSMGDVAVDFVKPYFASNRTGTSIDATLLKEQAGKQFAGGDMKGLDLSKLNVNAMNAVAASGSVETFPLVHPADTNQHQGVYIYLDEVGLLKKLETNLRAQQIAESCGYNPPPTFHGDIFIGRVATRPTMTNVDFKVGTDTDRGAEWMRRAISENLAWQQQMNQVTGQTGQSQPAAIGSEGRVAQENEFRWTQDEEEVEVTLDFDQDVNKKALEVKFLPRRFKVSHRENDFALDMSLYDKVDVDGCTWTLEGATRLVVTLEKAKQGVMWPRIKE